MKRIFPKVLLFLCSFVCLMTLFIFGVSAKDVKSGGFIYSVSGTTATVKEYTGTAKSVKIPSKVGNATVKKIGDEAFWSVKTMTSVTIPSTVTSIGKAAFNECTGLTKVVIPSKVTKIGSGAFWYCTNLKTVVIPKSVTSIGSNAFKGCNKLTAYVIKGSYGEKHIKTLSNVKLGYRYLTSIKLLKTSASLQIGEELKLTYTVSPSVVYNKKVSYTSSDSAVVAVSSSGVLTPKKPGTATITVKAKDGSGKKATCKITVTPKKITKFVCSTPTPTSYTLKWTKSEGATHYSIFRYNEKTKKWENVVKTKKTSYKITGLPLASVTKYKIRGYIKIGKTYYKAPYSAVLTAKTTTPAVPASLKCAVTNKTVTLSWAAAKNATGYQVYYYNPATKATTYINKTTATSLKISSLKPNTEYSFVVRSSLTSGKNVTYSAFSKPVTITTLPDYVSGLALKEDSLFISKLTLQWKQLPGVDGYRILELDEKSGNYLPFGTVDDCNTTEYTAEDLMPGTSYSFKIQAFVNKSGDTVYGYNSKETVTVTTNSRPSDNREAFAGFLEGYNASKNSAEDFLIISTVTVSDFEGESSEEYSPVVSALGSNSEEFLFIKSGVDSASKLPVTSILAPKDAFCTISYEQLEADSVNFDDDGNGFRLSFALPEDDGTVNELIAGTLDFDAIAELIPSFVLNECTYNGTTVNAKVQNGKIDDIVISVPVTVNFNIGDTVYEFSETITKEFLFIW